MAKKADKPPARDFGSARQRLDEILAELEQDGGDVDRLAERIKEASGLIRFCRERLSAARAEVRSVVAELEQQGASEGDSPADAEAAPPPEPPAASADGDPDAPLDEDELGEGSLPF